MSQILIYFFFLEYLIKCSQHVTKINDRFDTSVMISWIGFDIGSYFVWKRFYEILKCIHIGRQIDRFTVCVHTYVLAYFICICLYIFFHISLFFCSKLDNRAIKRNTFSCSFLYICISFIILITHGAMRIRCLYVW